MFVYVVQVTEGFDYVLDAGVLGWDLVARHVQADSFLDAAAGQLLDAIEEWREDDHD